jgi:hypothetical protein
VLVAAGVAVLAGPPEAGVGVAVEVAVAAATAVGVGVVTLVLVAVGGPPVGVAVAVAVAATVGVGVGVGWPSTSSRSSVTGVPPATFATRRIERTPLPLKATWPWLPELSATEPTWLPS